MKKLFKIFVIFFLVVSVGIGGYWVYIKYIADNPKSEALALVPGDAIFVVETSNINTAWDEISDSKVWNFLIKNKFFNDMNESIEMLNTYVKKNTFANMMLNNRELIMSAHMVSKKDWDFVFVVDLKDASSIAKGGLKQALGFIEGFKITERKFEKETIIELTDVANPKSKIYMSVINNLLVTTFRGMLIEEAIQQKNDIDKDAKNNPWLNKEFTEVADNLGRKKLFNFIFNYDKLNDFSRVFMGEDSEAMKMMSNSLTYSSLNINIKDEILEFKGFTGIDSLGSYVKALSGVKPGKMQAWNIMSDQTAFYFSMGFSNFMDFYNNLINQYRNDNAKDMEDIEANVKLLEKYLDISLQENFFDWIGSEIAFIKLRPSKKTRMEDVIVAIQAKDIEKAKLGLGHITKKIRKRTPVKFKKEEYRNFEINILARRGIFKAFFGKMFKGLEKPYFTYIGNYVVMSNSIEALKQVIDDFITDNTLKNVPEFMDFKDEFSSKSNISVFIRMPKIYENMYYYSNAEDKKSIRENSDFILSFARIGFQLVSDDKMFATTLLAEHDPEAVNADKLEKTEREVTESDIKTLVDSMSFVVQLPPEVLAIDTTYIETFEDPDFIKIEGEIMNGKPAGIWKTYYESGNVKTVYNYRDGKLQGDVTFYFDDNVHTIQAELKFDEGEINSPFEEYYKTGVRKSKLYYKHGVAHGEAEYYHPNGKIKITGEYRKGLKHGRWEYFNTKGKSEGKQKWKKGILKK